MKKISLEQVVVFTALVLGAVLMRLVPHPPNLAPIGALALFSGATMPNIIGFTLPLIAMVLSDLFLGFHTTVPFVYGSFILITGIGYLLHKKITPLKVGLGSLVGSILFFIITNFGVWVTSSMYTKNMNGILKAYLMGLPFFRNTLIGDLFYNMVLFGGYVVVLFAVKQAVLRVKDLVHYHLS